MGVFNYKKAIKEYESGQDLVGVVQRNKGSKKEYQKLFNYIKYGEKIV